MGEGWAWPPMASFLTISSMCGSMSRCGAFHSRRCCSLRLLGGLTAAAGRWPVAGRRLCEESAAAVRFPFAAQTRKEMLRNADSNSRKGDEDAAAHELPQPLYTLDFKYKYC